MTFWSRLAFVIPFCLPAFAADDPAATAVKRAAAPLPTDVLAILAPAIEAQRGSEFESNLRDCSIRLNVETRDREKGTLNFELERLWARPELNAPDRMWTKVKDTFSGKEYEEGFDGENGWVHDEKGVVVYDGPNYRTDRAKIQDDLDLMHLFMQFFLLRNALPELRDAKCLPDADLSVPKDVDSKEMESVPCERIEAKMTLSDVVGGESVVTLSFAKDSHLLRGIAIAPLAADQSKSEVRFDEHHSNPQGVIVPAYIALFRNGEKQPSQLFRLNGVDGKDGEVHVDLRFNTGVTLDRFAVPQGKSKPEAGGK